jgi:membrane-bound metal-dependent hydrolase YbcI (DUF457 family)
MAFFALLGALLPDVDMKIKRMHRKIFHNIWFLIIILFLGFKLGSDKISSIALSIGFVSHLISDSLTHRGIMPFWPIKKPKFNGPVKTGGLGEYLIVVMLLLLIYWIGTLL